MKSQGDKPRKIEKRKYAKEWYRQNRAEIVAKRFLKRNGMTIEQSEKLKRLLAKACKHEYRQLVEQHIPNAGGSFRFYCIRCLIIKNL